MTYHQGTTATGHLIHAVEFKDRQYAKRTVCGARVKSTRRRSFGQDPIACTRCLQAVTD